MGTRYLVGGCLGAAAALALLYLMHWLIHSDEPRLSPAPETTLTEFVRIIADRPPAVRPDHPEPPPPPEPPPIDRPQIEFTTDTPRGLTEDFRGPPPERQFVRPSARADGDLMAIVHVQPVYPRRAIERAIEGYVIVEFTVNALGLVEDPVVVEAHPPGIFDQAALQAAARSKYHPRVVNGHPVAVAGVRTQLSFTLDP